MPSVRYYNQSAPFWDFIANLEDQGFANRGAANDSENNEQPNPWAHPWAQQGWGGGFPFASGGPFPHRGRHGPSGPPPAPEQQHDPTPAADNENEGEAGPSESRSPPPPFSEHGPPPASAHHARCGGRGRGDWGGRGRGGPRHGGPFPHAHRMGGFGALAQLFQDQLFSASTAEQNKDKDQPDDFTPEADVFDTPSAFIIHLSLPGAKKEDVGVHWDAEKSELGVAGVVYRPGDEALLQTLALDERKVGAFERKVRLGSRANPAQVDVEGIAARLEDGVLRVEVPKLDGGFVEIKKVDVE